MFISSHGERISIRLAAKSINSSKARCVKGLQLSLVDQGQTTALEVGIVRRNLLHASRASAPLCPFPTKIRIRGRWGMVRSSRISRRAESPTASPARLITSHSFSSFPEK